jgi:hypothetical protein
MRLPFREWSRIDGKFPADWNFFFQVLASVAEVTRVVWCGSWLGMHCCTGGR